MGWWFPLIAAGLLIIVAMFGLLSAAVAGLVSASEFGYAGSAGALLLWEFLLPAVCAVLFVGAHRRRMGPDSIL